MSLTNTPPRRIERVDASLQATPDSKFAQEFYAERVGTYARVIGALGIGLYFLGFFGSLLLAREHFWEVNLHPGKLAGLGTGIALWFAGGWLRRRKPKTRAPLLIETSLAIVIPASMALGGLLGKLPQPLYLVVVLILFLALVLRAALVPSPPSRTAWIGIVATVPIVGMARFLPPLTQLFPNWVTPTLIQFGLTGWCLAAVGVSVVVSRVIYGLQREVQDARQLGQYLLEEKIGEGGMGAVYRASHALLRRPTAIKLLLPQRTGAQSLARFEREVQLTSRLSHPNTVVVFDYGRTADGIFYYAMEYLDGVSLEDLVKQDGAQPPGRVIHILLQATSALTEAHGIGLIHRDVKPANILLCERGGAPDVVKVVDFGLVKNLVSTENDDATLTQAGTITGTPHYLAPETITDPEHVDHLADVYALGAVGYFLLTGRPVFEGNTVVEVCGHHLHTPPRPPSDYMREPCPAQLESLILSCLAKSKADRPQSCEEMHQRLVECASAAPWSAGEARSWWSTHPKRRTNGAATTA